MVALRFFEDLTIAETALALGCTESTIRAYTSRALGRLRVGLTPPPDRTPIEREDDHAH